MNHQLSGICTGSAINSSLRRALLTLFIVTALNQPGALALGWDHNQRWDSNLRQAFAQSDPVAQEKYARNSLEHAQQLGADNFRVGRSNAILGHALARQGRINESRKCLREAIRIMEPQLGPNYPDLVGAYALTGVMADDFPTAQKNFKKAAQIADSIGANDGLIDVLHNYRVLLRAYQKTDPEAEARYQLLRKLFPKRGTPNGLWDVSHAAAFIAIKNRQPALSEKYTRRMILFADRQPALECLSWLALGEAQLNQKAYADGHKSCEEAVAINLRSINNRDIQIRCLRFMARLALAEGKKEEAESYFRQAVAKLADSADPEPFLFVDTLNQFADFLQADNRLVEAARCRRRAMKILSTPRESWSSTEAPTKYVSFPTRYCLGDLYEITGQEKKLIGSAQGKLQVKVNSKLLLHITDPDLSRHADALKGFKPDDLWGVSFVGIKIKQGDLRVIAHLNRLHDINLFGTEIHDSSWVYLRTYTQLEALDLTDTFVSSQGAMALDMMPQLKELSLSMTGVDDQCSETLGHLASLDRLSLARTNIGDKTASRLESLLALSHLDLSDTKVSDQGLDHISQLTNLTHLWLNHCRVSKAGISKLSTLKKLQILNLSGLDQSVFDTAEKMFPHCHIYGNSKPMTKGRQDTIPSQN